MTEGEKQLRRVLAASCGTCCVLTSTQSAKLSSLLASGQIDKTMIRRIGWDSLADQVTTPGRKP